MIIKEKLIVVIKTVLFLGGFAFFLSCNKSVEKEKISKEIFKASNATVSKEKYLETRKILHDSLNHWADSNLQSFIDWKKYSCKIDTLICFNKKQDRIVTVKLIRDTFYPDASMDYLQLIYGARFNNKWFFFNGESVVLPRDGYQTRTNIPLNFEKLHEIAVDEVFSKFFKKTKSGTLILNEAIFMGMEDKNLERGYGNCLTCKSFQEYVIYRSKENWKKRINETH